MVKQLQEAFVKDGVYGGNIMRDKFGNIIEEIMDEIADDLEEEMGNSFVQEEKDNIYVFSCELSDKEQDILTKLEKESGVSLDDLLFRLIEVMYTNPDLGKEIMNTIMDITEDGGDK